MNTFVTALIGAGLLLVLLWSIGMWLYEHPSVVDDDETREPK